MTKAPAFKHGFKEVEPGVRLHYVELGVGPKTLVLIHGFPQTWWEWRLVMPAFAEADFRVIAVDYRGAGSSSKPPSGYDKLTMARDIRSLVVEGLGVSEPIYLVGHDLGMKVAFAYAAQFAEGVQKLVLVDAIIPGAEHFSELVTTGKLAGSDISHFWFHNAKDNMAETLTAGRERVYIQDFFNRHAYNAGAFPLDVVDTYAAAYSAPGGMKAAFEVYRAFDQDAEDNRKIFADQGRLRTPTLFLAGEESGFLSTVADRIVGEVSEQGSFAVIPRSGHYPSEENPEDFVKEVLAFCG